MSDLTVGVSSQAFPGSTKYLRNESSVYFLTTILASE